MEKSRMDRGQFSLIAALLVTMLLVASVITTYAAVRNLSFQRSSDTSSSIEEMNLSIKNILEFTLGRYGSILKVTGNPTFANEYASDYIEGGLLNIARQHPEWSPSFTVDYSSFSTRWFEGTSYSRGDISVKYSLSGLGIDGVKYEASVLLNATILESPNSPQTQILVERDGNRPDLTLGRHNFFFYRYSYSESAWMLVNPTNNPIAFFNGTYLLDIPPGVDPASYMVQVVDQRGITATAFFSQSRHPQYTYSFTWDDEKYEDLSEDTMVIEVLQNGTLRWLGQNLVEGRPIPPIPVKAFHVNQTIDGVNKEVPFQVENWASNYRVPLGLSSNESIFSNRDMIVFLVNHKVRNVTLWWDGRDIATQTPYATTNRYFLDDDPENRELTNGILTINIDFSEHTFRVISTVGTSKSEAEFMRINDEVADYGDAEPTYAIHHSIVRDVVQHEVEWDTGAPDCPNMYAQVVLTLPANATYYTFALRTIFVNSTQYRNLWDLSPIQLSSSWIQGTGLQSFTENGTTVAETYIPGDNVFYNFSQTVWAHHWSEYIKDGSGAGMMFTNSSNLKLYTFDSIAEEKTGALHITTDETGFRRWKKQSVTIEFSPVARFPASFTYPLDLTWYGAVVTFDGGDPIWSDDNTGIWVLVEHPSIITVG